MLSDIMGKKIKEEKSFFGVLFLILAVIVWVFALPVFVGWLWDVSSLAMKTGWEFTYWQWWGVLIVTGIVLRDKM